MRSSIRLRNAVLIAGGALGLAASLAVRAAPCAVLQYEEMKDMAVEELSHEYCKAMQASDENLQTAIQDAMANLRSGGGDEAAIQMLRSEAAQCRNEGDRITRLMVRKGVTAPADWYKALCKKG